VGNRRRHRPLGRRDPGGIGIPAASRPARIR
jgi:hypothetical protein